MATARQLISRSLRMLGVLASGEEPAAPDADDALMVLNDMLRSYVLSGAPAIPDMTLDTTGPYPSTHNEGISALLSIRLAPEYGVSAGPEVMAMAQRGERLLRAYYRGNVLMVVDDGLLRRPGSANPEEMTWGDLARMT